MNYSIEELNTIKEILDTTTRELEAKELTYDDLLKSLKIQSIVDKTNLILESRQYNPVDMTINYEGFHSSSDVKRL